MELIDTPNPNAKKIGAQVQEHEVKEDLYKITHYCKYQGYHICVSCYNDKLKNKL